MCAFRPPQMNMAPPAVPIFTTRSLKALSTAPAGPCSLHVDPSHVNPFSFSTSAQRPPVVPLAAVLCSTTSDAPAAAPKGEENSVSRCSVLSRSVSSFAISSASENVPSVPSTRAASPVPQINLDDQSSLLRVVPVDAKTPVETVSTTSLSLAKTVSGAKVLFRQLVNKNGAVDGVHADEVMDLYLSPTSPWFGAGVLVVALCLVNRYTARFPEWYRSNVSAVENDTRRRRTTLAEADHACGQTLNLQNAARTLLAALQTATKFYADTTYQNASLCRVWNDSRSPSVSSPVSDRAPTLSSSVKVKLTASRLAASEWRLMQELGFSAWVEAEEYNMCLEAVTDLASLS